MINYEDYFLAQDTIVKFSLADLWVSWKYADNETTKEKRKQLKAIEKVLRNFCCSHEEVQQLLKLAEDK